MPYALQFDGVNDIVTFSSAMTGNAGTSAYTMRVKSGPSGITLPASGLAAFIGTSTNSAQTGIMTNSAGRLMIYTSASLRYGSTNGFIQSGVPFDITLTHNAGGTWDFYDNINGVTNSSGTFTTNTLFGNLNCFGRASSTNTTHLQGQIEFIEVTGLANSEKWDANLSDGAGPTLPTVSGGNQGTLNNFTVPDCWIFYSAGGSWYGTIGKTSLTVTTKSLFTALGYQTNVGLLDLITNNKQQNISTGYNSTIVKTTDDLLLKQLFIQNGNVLGLNKYTEDVSYKQLSVQAGTSVSFTGLLNKQNYPVTYKQLSNRLGWLASSQKQTLLLNSKQESIRTGFIVEQSKQSLTLAGEQLSVTAGTSVSFVGTLSKQNYLLSQKALGSSLGAVITVPKANLPISFKPLSKLDTLSLTIGKSSLSLTGKALGLINGHLLEAQKHTLNLVVKQLSLGEVVYPIVPVERLFTIEHKNNIYIFKQNINVHIMKGK